MKEAPKTMNGNINSSFSLEGLMQFLQNASEIFKRYHEILTKVAEKFSHTNDVLPKFDSLKVIKAIQSAVQDVYSEPSKAIAMQGKYIEKSIQLINYTMERLAGGNPLPIFEASQKDHRFRYETWHTNLYFDLLKQLYLLNSEWLNELLMQSQIDAKTKKLASFFIKQFINAAAPNNFLFTNPEVLQEFLSTNGASLLNGLNNLSEDIENSGDIFDISRTDEGAFEVGKNIASTPGYVIFKNELLELISYTPAGTKIYDTPLLIVPPFINKYYILDLSARDSLVRWLTEQGLAVFLISWVNPLSGELTFEDYLLKGVLTAIEFVLKTFDKPKLNILGYCVGGTLTSMLVSYLAKQGKENIINSASFLTTLTNFTEVGDVSAFIDEDTISAIECSMEKTGYYSGDVMNLTFSILRANDMIWFFIINNYLMGKKPLPFDILYWNADPTRLPAKMYSFYLRNMYLENNLVQPGKIVIANTPIDLRLISVPCHFIATQYDHIAPWKSVYTIMNVLNCERTFTLAGSGHVAGIVNPPVSNKYTHHISDDDHFPEDPEAWLRHTKEMPGSWWPHWGSWVIQRSGKQVSVETHNKTVESVKKEKAPGSYVRAK